MSEQDILDLIGSDPWMMDILHIAEEQALPDWAIGAGFVRNKIWDYLHGYSNVQVDTNDIDLVYFDPSGNNQQADETLSARLQQETGLRWEIVNEYYAHVWNGLPPYQSTEDAISQWPETVTAIGVTLHEGTLKLIQPYGVDDIVNMLIRPTPMFVNKLDMIRERVEKKQWLQKWPRLRSAEM